jgi:hypothetical protein
MEREELIQLVERVMAGEGDSEEEHDELVDMLESNVTHPGVVGLIYYPEREMTAAEIVDEALAYRPVEL